VFKTQFCGPRKILPYVVQKSFYAAFGKYSICILQLISLTVHEVKVWNSPYTGLDRPLGLQEVEAVIIYRQWAHEGGKFVSHTHWPPLPPGKTLVFIYLYGRMRRTKCHSAAGRINSRKIPSEPIRNRTCDHFFVFRRCNAV
jgi:hypothetical protein